MAEQPGIEPVNFNINGGYPQSIVDLRDRLLNHPDPKPEDLPHVLRRQKTPRAPPRWMYIKLTSGEKHATLAVRDDNVYLVGFRSQNGKWFEFGKESRGSKPIIDEHSIFLGFDGDYGGIQDLDIQSSSITSTVCCLANLEERWDRLNKKRLQKDLRMLFVMVCESARMKPLLDKATTLWRLNNDGIKIDENLFDYIRSWKKISSHILTMSWPNNPIAGISSRDDAIDKVRLILNFPRRAEEAGGGGAPPPTSQGRVRRTGGASASTSSTAASTSSTGAAASTSSTPAPPAGEQQQGKNQQRGKRHSDHGSPMMEVFALRADHDGFRPVGTLAIFDGRRGQVIYRHDGHGAISPASKADLLLTGPYRAVSADGCVAIEYSDGQSASSNVLETIWDPYDDAEKQLEYSLYDKPLTKSIIVAEGRCLKMSYAVLSNAVEATVQVDLLLSVPSEGLDLLFSSGGRTIRVHGEITAHSQLINDNGDKNDVNIILLFRREMEEALEVVQSTSSFAGSTIPLARSVLAWPCGSPLVIKVVLQKATSPISSQGGTSTSTSSSTSIPFQGLDFSFDDHDEDRISLSPLQGIGYVRVSVNVTGKNWLPPGPSTIKMDDGHAMSVETDLLVVHHPGGQLRFTLEPNKLQCMHYCPLHITNDTADEPVAFRLLLPAAATKEEAQTSALEPEVVVLVSGILQPNTTGTYLVRLEEERRQKLMSAPNMDALDMILQSCVAIEGVDSVDDNFRRQRRPSQEIDKTTLKAIVCDDDTTAAAASDQVPVRQPSIRRHGIEIIPGQKPTRIDLHPVKPWILACDENSGEVCIWNYETTPLQAEVKGRLAVGKIRSIKFIATDKEERFIAGSEDGYIYVYTCDKMEEKHKIKAHEDGVRSLDVHPSKPHVLSTGWDKHVKLWSWEAKTETGWDCIQMFESNSTTVRRAKFNPDDVNAFASIAGNFVEVWEISNPPRVTRFSTTAGTPICFDYFSTGGDQLYMVIGSHSASAHIWDLENNSCITQVDRLQKSERWNVGVVQSHLGRPILIASSLGHYVISLYDCITYRCERSIDLKLGCVHDVLYIKSTGSLVICCEEGTAIVEL